MSDKIEMSRQLFDEMMRSTANKARLNEQLRIIELLKKIVMELEQEWKA